MFPKLKGAVTENHSAVYVYLGGSRKLSRF